MRPHLSSAVLCFAGALLLASPGSAETRGGQLEGFGGLTFGTTATASTFGGGVAIPLGGHVQILGEAGRMSNLTSPLLDQAFEFLPVDVQMSAWYAQGGLRFTASRDSFVRPYVQGTAGIARLRPGIRGGGQWGGLADAALGFVDQREPLVGAGAGVMLQGGPILVDVGYRYTRILAGGGLASAFALGRDAFEVSQVRVGVGIRF